MDDRIRALAAIRRRGYEGPVLVAAWDKKRSPILVSWQDMDLEETGLRVVNARHHEWETALLLGIETELIGVVSALRDHGKTLTLGRLLDSGGHWTRVSRLIEERPRPWVQGILAVKRATGPRAYLTLRGTHCAFWRRKEDLDAVMCWDLDRAERHELVLSGELDLVGPEVTRRPTKRRNRVVKTSGK